MTSPISEVLAATAALAILANAAVCGRARQSATIATGARPGVGSLSFVIAMLPWANDPPACSESRVGSINGSRR